MSICLTSFKAGQLNLADRLRSWSLVVVNQAITNTICGVAFVLELLGDLLTGYNYGVWVHKLLSDCTVGLSAYFHAATKNC